MATNSERLLTLAEAEFPDLSAAEREVVRCASMGEWASLLPLPPKPQPEGKKKPRTGGLPLRSALVEWLCTDRRAQRLLHRKGIRIKHATLDAEIDLSYAEVPFFFGLYACRLRGLDAARTHYHANLYLKDCLSAGTVDLIGTTIRGQLLLDGARIWGKEGVAVRGDGADIKGGTFLSEGFLAKGEVFLLGAKIGANLECRGGRFLNETGKALNGDGADIKGSAFLTNGFHAEGEVNLLGAKIGANLECQGGRFLNTNGTALKLERAEIYGALLLDPVAALGEFSLYKATVATTLRMLNEATSTAKLDLRGAKIGQLYDSPSSWPSEQGALQLDGFQYDEIDHESPLSAKERLEWLGRMPSNQFYPQPYEQLAACLQKTGHDGESKAVRIAKEQRRSADFTNPFKSIWWELKHIFVGHGYRAYFSIYWLLGLILLGSATYTLNIDDMTTSVSYNLNATEPAPRHAKLLASDYPDLNTMLYSTDVALPIVDLQQERYWMPNSSSENGRALWLFNWFEVLFGWFLTSMGIAGATGIIRKD